MKTSWKHRIATHQLCLFLCSGVGYTLEELTILKKRKKRGINIVNKSEVMILLDIPASLESMNPLIQVDFSFT